VVFLKLFSASKTRRAGVRSNVAKKSKLANIRPQN